MLTKPDVRVVKALVGLENNPDWEIARTWLKGNRSFLQERMSEERDETTVRWIQGALQLLGDLFLTQDQARETLNKYKQSESRGNTGSFNEPL
jgi:hypothetical protein